MSAEIPPWLRPPQAWRGERRAAIIGAGFAGTAAALALARRGFAVTLVERHAAPAGEASGNPLAVAMHTPARQPNPRAAFHAAAFEHFLDHIARLDADGQPAGYRQCGVLSLRDSDADWPQTPLQLSVDRAAAEALAGQPLPAHIRRALWLPSAGCQPAPALCAAQLAASGAGLIAGREVARLQRAADGRGDHWLLRDAAGATICRAPLVVIAAGRDAARLAPGLPLQPLRGQIGQFPAAAIDAAPRCAICAAGYVAPDADGGIVFGASYHPGVADDALWLSDRAANLARLRSLLPALRCDPAAIRERAAVRIGTPDRLPLAGGLPDWAQCLRDYGDLHRGPRHRDFAPLRYRPGLYLACGLGSRGATTAALVAEVLADQIEGRDNRWARLLHPARALIGQLRRKPEHRRGAVLAMAEAAALEMARERGLNREGGW